MITLSDWLPSAVIGATFTTIGLLKVYGFRKGIVGGGGKPLSCRLFGKCPTWSKQFNNFMVLLFLGIGVVNLGILVIRLLKS